MAAVKAHVPTTPDVLSWACLAAGALSECEHEESQDACGWVVGSPDYEL